MPRVKRSLNAKKKRRSVLEQASGYWGLKSKVYRRAKEQVIKSGNYALPRPAGPQARLPPLWIIRINAGARQHGISYSQFMHGLKLADIEVDRKILADLAATEPVAFGQIAERAKAALAEKAKAATDAGVEPSRAAATSAQTGPPPARGGGPVRAGAVHGGGRGPARRGARRRHRAVRRAAPVRRDGALAASTRWRWSSRTCWPRPARSGMRRACWRSSARPTCRARPSATWRSSCTACAIRATSARCCARVAAFGPGSVVLGPECADPTGPQGGAGHHGRDLPRAAAARRARRPASRVGLTADRGVPLADGRPARPRHVPGRRRADGHAGRRRRPTSPRTSRRRPASTR